MIFFIENNAFYVDNSLPVRAVFRKETFEKFVTFQFFFSRHILLFST